MMPESPAVPAGHPVEVAVRSLLHRTAGFQLTLARGAPLAQVQVEARALQANAARLLAHLEQAEADEPGFIDAYALQLQAAGEDLQGLFEPHTQIPDDPSGLDG
jgi:hypothetical protein